VSGRGEAGAGRQQRATEEFAPLQSQLYTQNLEDAEFREIMGELLPYVKVCVGTS